MTLNLIPNVYKITRKNNVTSQGWWDNHHECSPGGIVQTAVQGHDNIISILTFKFYPKISMLQDFYQNLHIHDNCYNIHVH